MAAVDNNELGQQQGADKSRNTPGLSKAADAGRPARSKSGNDLAGSAAAASTAGDANGSTVTGLSAIDSPVSGSPPGSSAGAAGNASNGSMPPIAAGPRGEESLSATLERLRLNAQAAKNGAQSGNAGAIGSRDGRGPAPNSRLAKNSLPAATAGLARGGSNNGAATAAGAGAQNDPQMSNFLFDDELDSELHNSTYGGRYLQMNADDDKFPVLIRRDSFPGIQNQSRNAFMSEHGGRTSEWPQFTGSNGTNTASTATTQKATTGNSTPTAVPAPAGPPSAPTNRMSADMSSVVNGARRGGESSPRGRQLPPPRSATTGTSPSSVPASGPGGANSVQPSSAATTATSASNGGSTTAATAASTATNGTTTATTGSERSSPSLGDLPGGSPKKAAAGLNGSASPEEMKRKAQLIRERERLAANGAHPANAAAHNPGHKFSDGTPSPAAKYANELAALNGTFSPYPLEPRNGGYNGPADQAYGGGYGGQFPGRRGPGGPPQGQQGGQRGKEEPNRFAGLRLEDLQGDMAALCKDQHGCRFLQKKLEEGNAEHRDMIFNEIYPHFGELMTDSFGNYLSQKLLEHCSDEQRDALLESISGELVSISLNMHGTRAVQKMIDYLSTQRQVQSLIMALNLNVVTLIKDLNGNHVIQKCLNTLPPEDNQFIYNAVAANCIEVATHRHGCCVLQRCIDHASESQRIQLVTEITYNSLTLVLDPFGNYVVQYVLDLNDSRFITAIVNQFRNNVCALSAQKFSSNVVEKCVRVADLEGRKNLISELIDKSRLERMLRDSFANYVVQTALDYAEPGQRAELVAIIRPVLPMIRNTPYGKRIQSKIQREGFQDGYGRGGWHHHPGMYGPPQMGYYGMPGYGPPQHGGPPHGGPQHQGGPHNGPPAGYHPGGPAGGHYYGPPQGGNEGPMGRSAGPYGHQHQHMQPPHMASPAISHAFSPSFGPTNAVPMEYPQGQNYNYL